ncbi:MAG: DNA-3-methyladenine glycosylase I [Candidatus Acidiferrales bacterium]
MAERTDRSQRTRDWASGARLAELLGLRSEVREEWVISPAARRKTWLVCAFTGFWGVLTGFVLFIHFSRTLEEGAGNRAVWQFLGVVIVAVVVVTVIEWLRDLIREGGRAKSRRSMASILISVLVLVLFELCTVAYEEVSRVGMESRYVLEEIAGRVIGTPEQLGLFLTARDIKDLSGLLKQLSDTQADNLSPASRVLQLIPEDSKWALLPDKFAPTFEQFEKGQNAIYEDMAKRLGGSPDARRQQGSATSPAANSQQSPSGGVGTIGSTLPFPLLSPTLSDLVKSSLLWPNTGKDTLQTEQMLYQWKLDELRNTGEDTRKGILTDDLNRMLLRDDFYDARYFAELDLPIITDVLEQDQKLRKSIAQLREQEQSAGTAGAAKIEKQISRAELELLPIRRVVQLNRDLLDASFDTEIGKPEQPEWGWRDLAALGGIWAVAGMALGALLALPLFETGESKLKHAGRSAIRGALAAIVVAPLGVMGYVLLLRCVSLVEDALWHHTFFSALVNWHSRTGNALVQLALLPLSGLVELLHYRPWGVLTCAALVAALLFFCWKRRTLWPLLIIGQGFAALVVAPFLNSQSALVLVLVMLVWIVPGLFLGFILPYLKLGAKLPRHWGIMAVASGILLALVVGLRFREYWWMFIPAALLVFTGWAMRRGWPIEEYWPLVAFAAGLVICGATSLFQEASFRGVLADVHTLQFKANTADDIFDLHSPWWRSLLEDPHALEGLLGGFDPFLELKAAEERDLERQKRAELAVTKRLELCIAAALGFWVTIGLLAGWSIHKNQPRVQTSPGEPPRCFWAAAHLRDFHDKEHGMLPENDQQLFERLALELLVDNRFWAHRELFRKAFQGFVPENVAMLSVNQVRKVAPDKKSDKQAHAALASNAAVPMVIENARRLLAAWSANAGPAGAEPSSKSALLLRHWQERARTDPDGLIKEVRRMFVLRSHTPLRTFFASMGLFPNAHFPGCFIAPASSPRTAS